MVFLTIVSISQIEARCDAERVSNQQIKKLFKPFTITDSKGRPKNNSPCWWDLTKTNCGTCKNGGKQCGYPMHKWCQSPKSKKGCKGIPNNQFTLSTEGAPCYFDNTNLKCAWCTKKTVKQCAQSQAQMNNGCYSYCGSAKDRTCDGNLFSCLKIPFCAHGASCIKKTGRCACKLPYVGNGYQCFSGDCETGNCTLVQDPLDDVQVKIDTQSEFFVYTLGSGSTEL